jgi:H+/Cl- antiporter ClcA
VIWVLLVIAYFVVGIVLAAVLECLNDDFRRIRGEICCLWPVTLPIASVLMVCFLVDQRLAARRGWSPVDWVKSWSERKKK